MLLKPSKNYPRSPTFSLREDYSDRLPAPAGLWDALSVTLSVAKLGKVTLDLEQSVQREDDALCKGSLRLASVEPGSLKPKVMPDDLLSLINHPSDSFRTRETTR